MAELIYYSPEHISKLVVRRGGEVKLGETFGCISNVDELRLSTAKFILLGLPEDVGIKANYGLQGSATAWDSALNAFLNTQSNRFLTGREISVLGHIDFTKELERARNLDPNDPIEVNELRNIVSDIDNYVSEILFTLFQLGKVPLVVGGGHNNAYPVIKAFSQSMHSQVNVINLDAHSDFRDLEGRHSGNGFRYAFEQGFLNKYAVLGLQENYISEEIIIKMEEYASRISATYFDNLIRENSSFDRDFQSALNFTAGNCGLEIDMDCIAGILSSAGSNSGFPLNTVREMIALSSTEKLFYLHISEAVAEMADGRKDRQCGKNIAFLLTDFIKAQMHHHL